MAAIDQPYTDQPPSLQPLRYSNRRMAEHGGNIAEPGLQKAIRLRESTEPVEDDAERSSEQ